MQGSTGIASINVLEPTARPDIDTKKIFDDEKIASAGGYILPYTLDRINDVLVKAIEGTAEAKEMLKNTLGHPSLSTPQKEYLRSKIAVFNAIEKHIVRTAQSLDKLKINT